MITSFALAYIACRAERNSVCPTCRGAIPFYSWRLEFKVDEVYNQTRVFCSEECASMYLISEGKAENDPTFHY